MKNHLRRPLAAYRIRRNAEYLLEQAHRLSAAGPAVPDGMADDTRARGMDEYTGYAWLRYPVQTVVDGPYWIYLSAYGHGQALSRRGER